MALATCHVYLVNAASVHHIKPLGRASVSSRHKTKLEQSTFLRLFAKAISDTYSYYITFPLAINALGN
jgi:hypothetical protein